MTRSNRLLMAGFAAVLPLTVGAAGPAADPKLHTDQDLWEMVAAIAPSAASMQVKDLGAGERVMTIERDPAKGPVVTSVQVVPPGQLAQTTPGTLVLMIVHAPGECAAPSGLDDVLAAKGVETFVVSASGEEIWEVAKVDGGVSVRQVKDGPSPGAWEAFRKNPADYTLYRCSPPAR